MPLFHQVDAEWFASWLKDKFGSEYLYMSKRERELYLQSVAHQLLFICDEIELNAMRAAWRDVMENIGDKLAATGGANVD